MHTCMHARIFVRESAINFTFFAALRIRKSGSCFHGHYSQSCDLRPQFHGKCGQNGHCVNRMYRKYTHMYACTHICAQIGYKRHFFRCSANKEIWLLATIRRAALRIASSLQISQTRTKSAEIYLKNADFQFRKVKKVEFEGKGIEVYQ